MLVPSMLALSVLAAACESGGASSATGGPKSPPGIKASSAVRSVAATAEDPASVQPLSGDSGSVLILGSAIGQPYEVTVSVTIESQPSGDGATNSGSTEYELALVHIHGESGSYHYSASAFDFVDASGHHHLPLGSATVDRFGKGLGSGTVITGQNVDGHILFEVPVGGGAVELTNSIGRPMQWRTRT